MPTPALSPRPTDGEGEAKLVAAEVTRLTLTRNSERGIWENIRASLPRLLPVKALVVFLVSIGALAFWNLRHTEHSTTRRAFSVANVNDFSWRKRVAAYEGALQMIADKSWFGFGWNIPEPVYDKFYRKPKVDEGMAIQMNDYFMLGATLGIPALGCFVAYIWLSLTRISYQTKGGTGDPPVPSGDSPLGTEDPRKHPVALKTCHASPISSGQWPNDTGESPVLPKPAERPTLNSQLSTLNEEAWLRTTCRAGAIVLLVGFFFDGGLFKLATGATFWILIELGSASGVQGSRVKVQSSGNEGVQNSEVVA